MTSGERKALIKEFFTEQIQNPSGYTIDLALRDKLNTSNNNNFSLQFIDCTNFVQDFEYRAHITPETVMYYALTQQSLVLEKLGIVGSEILPEYTGYTDGSWMPEYFLAHDDDSKLVRQGLELDYECSAKKINTATPKKHLLRYKLL